ncbi:MAG TPA: VanZ family protein [Ureibacillus sp.]|nr:VanZ family protein [Ureibacillus sp.]
MNKKVAWAVVVFWMFIIFCLSHQPANVSNVLSTDVAKVVAQNFGFVSASDDFNLISFNSLIRKFAHFMLYFVLGIVLVSTLRKLGVTGIKGMILSILVCVLYAITDEWHQLFVDGRGAQWSDVAIDSAGAIIGIAGMVGIDWIVRSVRLASVK